MRTPTLNVFRDARALHLLMREVNPAACPRVRALVPLALRSRSIRVESLPAPHALAENGGGDASTERLQRAHPVVVVAGSLWQPRAVARLVGEDAIRAYGRGGGDELLEVEERPTIGRGNRRAGGPRRTMHHVAPGALAAR